MGSTAAYMLRHKVTAGITGWAQVPISPEDEPMKILSISSLFPPDVLGGAEMSAYNLACWLQRQGHQMTVLTTAKTPEEELRGRLVEGLAVYRFHMPRPYPMFGFPQAPQWQKPVWHLQDHLDPRNRQVVAEVLDAVRPDAVLVHLLPGIGYNALEEIAARDLPVVYFLHDLGLACVKSSMFRDGKTCAGQCMLCGLTSRYKTSMLSGIRRLGFCSPSRANLDRVCELLPLGDRPRTAILNANAYPRPTAARSASEALRLVYVGRLQATKGVALLLACAARAQETIGGKHRFGITVVGTGPEEAALREKYGAAPWCTFTGFVSQAEVANIMVDSDLLCVPSIWFENSPGVAIQALGLGLPLLASDVGGIPELVEADRNGRLVPPGDTAAWQAALEEVLSDPGRLALWRDYALQNSYRFNQDHLGNQILNFINHVCEMGEVRRPNPGQANAQDSEHRRETERPAAAG
jgi:glycosyltransferase involved in cell wall biosynthesis